MGVQVPHVNTAAEAREVLAAVKYHPAGRRGLAAGTRAAVYDSHGTLADYVKAANDATLVAIQLEDQPAIENSDELLKVDDIDVFFIGPSDLSQAMGHPGKDAGDVLDQFIRGLDMPRSLSDVNIGREHFDRIVIRVVVEPENAEPSPRTDCS